MTGVQGPLAKPSPAAALRRAQPRLGWHRNKSPALALLPPARDAEGMAKPLAKLVSVLTPKRRWAQCSLASIVLMFVPAVFGGTIWADDDLRESPEVRDVQAGIDDGLFSIKGLPQHSYSMNVDYAWRACAPPAALVRWASSSNLRGRSIPMLPPASLCVKLIRKGQLPKQCRLRDRRCPPHSFFATFSRTAER